ncbi:MAG: hypothetical protein WBD57_13655 [Candidatus Cybelea sp.]
MRRFFRIATRVFGLQTKKRSTSIRGAVGLVSPRVFAFVLCGAIGVFTTHATAADVKSASSDGEATVYLLDNFSADFDLAYRAVLKPAAHNKSWSSLSILLVGSQIPGPGASVGVASDPPHHAAARPFTYVVYPGLRDDYKSHSKSCSAGCLIELRGDARSIYAYVDRHAVASWSRSDLFITHPHVQLNAEVHGTGDSVYASLTPVRVLVAGRALPNPTCAFTTRGIEPAGRTTLTFSGKTNDAGGAFIELASGARADKC